MIQNFSAWHKTRKEWLNSEDVALSGDGQIVYTGSITPHPFEDIVIVRYVGKQDRHGKEIREKDIMLVKMSTIEYEGNYYEELEHTVKYIYGEVRTRTCGGLGLIVRKVIPEGEPGLKRGSFLRINTNKDEIIGNVLDTPELIE